MKIVFINGVWDIFHYGHYNVLKRAKSEGDYLLVGVASDESSIKYKKKPHQSWKIRANSVRNIPFVDKIIKTQWSKDLTKEFYKEHNINVQVQGDDSSDFLKAKEMGIFKKIGRTEGISSTRIERLINLRHTDEVDGGFINDIRHTFMDDKSYIIKIGKTHKGKMYDIEVPLSRINNEYETIMSFREQLDYTDFISNPICFNPDSYTIVFEKAPKEAILLSNDMKNKKLLDIVGALAMMHNATLDNEQLLKKHSDTESFLKVKIKIQCLEITDDEYIYKHIQKFLNESLKNKRVLLHGDFAPKNILVWGNRFLFIDFEESAYSDPALDIGYFISHYYLYGYTELCKNILDTYLRNICYKDNQLVERINKYIGIFILSRIDGRANFVDLKNNEEMRKIAKKLILGEKKL